jgi:hypothetical protein
MEPGKIDTAVCAPSSPSQPLKGAVAPAESTEPGKIGVAVGAPPDPLSPLKDVAALAVPTVPGEVDVAVNTPADLLPLFNAGAQPKPTEVGELDAVVGALSNNAGQPVPYHVGSRNQLTCM